MDHTKAFLLAASSFLFAHCSSPESSNIKLERTDTLFASQKEILIATGESLLKEHCAACHGTNGQRPEPDFIFTKLFERLPEPSQEYFLRFVRNSDDLLNEKNPYYMKIDSLFTISIKHQYKDKLTDKELKAIMAYVIEKNKENSY